MDELYMLGAVILLRALLSLLIHYEIGPHRKEKNRPEDSSSPASSSTETRKENKS
jgi:hypothetical protein